MALDVLTIAAAVLFGLYGYDLLISLAGFLPLRTPPVAAGRARFAVVVCAHNEERVIGDSVRSMLAQEYPAEKIDVYVVADNCSDGTAAAARDAGATAWERSSAAERGKGYALQWGMARLPDDTYDAVAVFDADNIVDSHFFEMMNRYLEAGHVAIQAYLDTKNVRDSWVTRCIALAYFVSNCIWFRARFRAGLSATLGGTGYCLRWDVLQAYRARWDPGALTDDLDLTSQLITDGVRVSYCHESRTYDEKPPTLRQSIRQRTRWMQGHNDTLLRRFPALMWGAIRHLSPRRLDAALYLLQPVRVLLAFSVLCALAVWAIADPGHPGLSRAFSFTIPGLALWAAVFVVYPILVAFAERHGRLALAWFPVFMLFSFSWIPAIAVGLVRMRRRVWDHTAHEAAGETADRARRVDRDASRRNS